MGWADRAAKEARVLRITIEMQKDGTVNVSGPLKDKALMYGMLGLAQDAVRNFNADTEGARRIMPVPAGAVLRPPGGSGGR